MKNKVLALTLAVTMATVGCSAAWVTTFESYLAIAGPAVIQCIGKSKFYVECERVIFDRWAVWSLP
jgi:hypothetical protein